MRVKALAAVISFCLALTILMMLWHPLQAHGGTVIQTGSVDSIEWLVMIYPYPTQPGVAVLTLFLFDYDTNLPGTGFEGEVYLAPPDASEPCCEPGVHEGPYVLYTDTQIYPGDYTTYIPLTAAGEWQVKFAVTSPKQNFDLIVPLQVDPPDGNQVVDAAAINAQLAAMTAAAQSMQPSVGGQSPLAAPAVAALTSPLSSPFTSPLSSGNPNTPASIFGSSTTAAQSDVTQPSRFSGWAWGGMAMVVIFGAVFSVIRVQRKEANRD